MSEKHVRTLQRISQFAKLHPGLRITPQAVAQLCVVTTGPTCHAQACPDFKIAAQAVHLLPYLMKV